MMDDFAQLIERDDREIRFEREMERWERFREAPPAPEPEEGEAS